MPCEKRRNVDIKSYYLKGIYEIATFHEMGFVPISIRLWSVKIIGIANPVSITSSPGRLSVSIY